MVEKTKFCPIPFEQQPLNEYQALKESWFFSWVFLPLSAYLQKLIWVWLIAWLIGGPIAHNSFSPHRYPGQFFLMASAIALFFLGLVLVRLYLGWFYVRSRLIKPVISYEESGWYDGQMWQKTPEAIAQDQLIVNYQLQPIFAKLHGTFAGLIGLVILGIVAWYFCYQLTYSSPI